MFLSADRSARRALASAGFVLLALTSCPPATPYTHCGGDADCPTCYRCDDALGLCVLHEPCDGATCIDGVCCAGCWQDGVCQPGSVDQACGLAGQDCAVCAAGSSCVDGACQGPAVRALSLSSLGTCALRHDGSVWCFGESNTMPLGIGLGSGATASPRRVVRGDRDEALGGVVSLQGAPANHCGLDGEGGIWCWGDGASNHLGTGSTSDAVRAVAVLDASGSVVHGFTRFDLGPSHMCALRGEGEVWCWGGNGSGQLGLGDGAPTAVPHPVAMRGSDGLPLQGVLDVSTGSGFTCVIAQDRTVWCTGQGNYGQLGQGAFASSSVPVPVLTASGAALGSAVELACGTASACARLDDGSVQCWGRGQEGQLGNDASDNQASAVTVRDLQGATALAMGDGYACAAVQDGSLWCWGDNPSARLGDGTLERRSRPVRVLLDAAAGRPQQLALASAHTAVLLEGGALWGWGSNSRGQLGVPVSEQTQVMLPQRLRELPAVDCAPARAVSIGTGGLQTSAVDDAGRLWCWGSNDNGQLGTGFIGYLAWTTQPVVTQEAGPQHTGFEAAACGADARHSCGLRGDGTVWCWGYGYQGQLGNGNGYTHAKVPVQVALAEGTPLVDAVGLAVGGAHTCAVRADATALCWGFNDFAQLGNGQRGVNQPWPGAVLVDASTTLQHVVAVAAGANHSCAALDDGQVRCWGESNNGETGSGTRALATYAVAVLTAADTPLTQVVALAAGDRFSCALQQGGALWCWGENAAGQLGDGGTADALFAVRSVESLGALTGVAAGMTHACAIASDGALWCWGGNTFGQLGDGSAVNRSTPVQVLRGADQPLTDVVQVAAGKDMTCAIDGEGGLWCWGNNASGQLAAPLVPPLSPWALPVALACP